jgi:3-oxoadipate enol-lactonase
MVFPPLASRIRLPEAPSEEILLEPLKQPTPGVLSKLEAAAERRPAVVFVHAFPLDSRMWRGDMEFAAELGHPSVALDLPGFGRSPLVPQEDSTKAPESSVKAGGEDGWVDAAADAVLSTVKAVGLARAVLVGCSMGGYIIFGMLRKRPTCAAGIVLCDTRATADSSEAKATRFQTIGLIEKGGRQEFLEGMLERLVAPGRLDRDRELANLLKEIVSDQSDSALISALRGLAERPDSTGQLSSIDVPTAVVVGAQDRILSVEEAEALARSINAAEFVVIDEAGHLPNLEEPQAFRQALRGLLGRVEAG